MFCKTSAVSGLHLRPLGLEELDQAVELRKDARKNKTDKGDQDFHVVEAEASYLNLSHSSRSLSASLSDNEFLRTGRWTNEEIAYVDFLLDAFDKGKLPMEEGVRLNDFLGEILMCKGSRLTKKMKNAKLSLRSYKLSPPSPDKKLDCEVLSTLQEKFFQSISNQATRLELRFTTTKAWRSHFSNFCVQLGSGMLDANDWISSLETMEQRATKAEESIRKARRRLMGLALKTDVRMAQDGVFFGGLPVQRESTNINDTTKGETTTPANNPSSGSVGHRKRGESVHSITSSDDGSEAEFIQNMLDSSKNGPANAMEDFSMMFSDLFENSGGSTSSQHLRNNCGSFLEEIVSYMEANDLPFQHVDVWVPSYLKDAKPGQHEDLRLCHAGHATRNDVDPALFSQLHEYGEYSTKFSFAPGAGLPGRVYATGKPHWETRIDEADPQFFRRAGGAKVYGVKTGLALPLATNQIGRMVVAMYSTSDIAEIASVVEKCVVDLRAYSPEPKWKLVVEMGPGSKEVGDDGVPAVPAPSQGSGLVHYQHSSPKLGITLNPGTLKSVPREHNYMTGSSVALTQSSQNPVSPQDVEQVIATLLGDHMPLTDLPGPGEPAIPSSTPSILLAQFMSLRLLLLRSASRRSQEEADAVEVIVKSFRGYSKEGRRSGKELAFLLVQEWQYLQALQKQPAKPSSDKHQCHVMDEPAVSTYSTSGAPTRMPSSLAFVDPDLVRKASFDDNRPTKQRRISSPSSNMQHFPVSESVNIVDESS